MEELYPGAGYEISVSAISYDLMSDPHSYFQTVLPRSPENFQISKHTNSTLSLTWSSPKESLVDHYIVRYRPFGHNNWREVTPINTTSIEIKDLTAGERYVFRVASVSNKAESPDIRELEQTLYPNPIFDVKHTIDSHNISFQWFVPIGRIDYYNIVYNTVREATKQESKQITANNDTDMMTVLIDSLKPGEQYSFRFYVISNKLRSEGIGLQIRTSQSFHCL